MTSKARQTLKGSGDTPQEKIETMCFRFAYNNANFCSSINFLQVDLHWDVHILPTVKKPNLPKATVELIASFFWCETSFLAYKYPERASQTSGR